MGSAARIRRTSIGAAAGAAFALGFASLAWGAALPLADAGLDLETVRRSLGWALAVAVLIGVLMTVLVVFSRREVRRRTAELEKERRMLRTLVNTLPDLVWLKDGNGVYLACNREFERYFGADEAHIVGRTDYDLVSREQADFYRGKDFEAATQGTTSAYEEEGSYAGDGRTVLLETIKSPMFDGAGNLIGVLGISRDITERRRSASALAASKARLLATLEQVPNVAVQWFDAAGRVFYWNPASQRLFGWSETEARGRPIGELIPAADGEGGFAAAVQELAEHGRPRGPLEHRTRHRAGAERYLMSSLFSIPGDNGSPVLVGMEVDITDRKLAEKAARDTEERFHIALHASPVAASVARVADGRFADVNERYLTDFGWARDEIVGRTSAEIGLWPDRAIRDAWISRLLAAGTLIDYETRWNDRYGRPRWVRISAKVIDLDDEPHILGFTVDVTERKAAEEALRRNEARYRSLYDSMLDGYARVDLAGCIVESNAAFRKMLGYSTEELAQLTYRDITPDEWIEAEAEILGDEVMVQGHSRLYEKAYRRRDGSVFPVELQTYLIRDDEGGSQGMWAIVRDITERHQNEEMLRLSARVFASAGEGIVITNPAGDIVAVNPAFTAITGYGEAEVLGRNPRFLGSGRHEPEFYQALWDGLGRHGQWQGELWNRRKNGEIYPEWLTISSVRDSRGVATHYVAVFSDITVVKESQEALRFLAHHDPLTGLPNRILLRDRLEHAVQRAQREDLGVAVLFVDLDRFKQINDSLGHPVGDEILKLAANAMAAQLRGSDTIARVGGDEFIIVLERDVSSRSVGTVARKLVEIFAHPFTVAGHELFLTASIGISTFPGDGTDPDTLLKHADLAMYRAKEQGRNNFQYYEPALGAGALARMRLENALRGAVQRGELSLVYQPQFRIASGDLVGMEALVRWEHPELGEVSPGRFIPVAEEIGLIGEIGGWVLRQVCRQIAQWRHDGFAVPRMSVNLSMRQIEREGLVAEVASLLAEWAIAPAQLELEVTESVLMRQTDTAIGVLEGLRQLGVFLAVDDFGTGYSSLAYLRQLPVHRLKIDSSFVRDIGRDPNDEAIARAIIALAHSLALDVVAEGVERQDQADFLRQAGCDVLQGRLHARPLAAAEILAQWG